MGDENAHMRYSGPGTFVAALVLSLTGCNKPTPQIRTYDMGQQVEVGRLIYTVFESEWLPQIGEGLGARIPQNRFFLIRLSATNSGSAELIVPAFTLVDDNGKTYEELQDGTDVPQWIGLLPKIKAAETAQGNIIFDAPPRHYKLRVTDDASEREALVDIPLTFNPGTPEPPAPGSGN